MKRLHPHCPTKKILALMASLAMGLCAADEKKTVRLTNSDGKEIAVELLEKSEDKVKFKLGRKVYTLPLDKLSKESAELVKKTSLPTMCNFRLNVDFSKRGTKKTRDRSVSYRDSEGTTVYRTETDSYRMDTITGEVTVKNLDPMDKSPGAKVHVAVLCNGKKTNQVIRRDVFSLTPIKRLGESTFEVGKATTWHTPRGQSMSPGGTEGRYSGYVAAIVIDGRIVEIKAAPSSFEEDIDAARAILNL